MKKSVDLEFIPPCIIHPWTSRSHIQSLVGIRYREFPVLTVRTPFISNHAIFWKQTYWISVHLSSEFSFPVSNHVLSDPGALNHDLNLAGALH